MAANNGASASSIVNDAFLHCPVCAQEFNAPKVLPCLHSFCFECLESSLEQSQIGPGQAFLCPICKTQCVVPPRGVRAMKSNIFLITLQEFFHTKTLDDDQECEACDSGRAARKKCIECTDWLCNQCCSMHNKVKITKDHHLVTPLELESGKYDNVIKESFEPLICSKHNEALRLYCVDPGCQAPICTVCKTTAGHDGHVAIELAEQAVKEFQAIQSLMSNVQRCIVSTTDKIDGLANEEKLTAYVRKKVHKAINDRSQEIIEQVVKQIEEYADKLHQSVEDLAKEHRKDIVKETEECRNKVQAATSAKAFAEALLGFNRTEELVSMSKEVRARLQDFQKPTDVAPPSWRQPRLNPPSEVEPDTIAKMFGTMTFEGEVVRSVMLKSFSAKTQYDEKDCALCDLALDADGNIVVVDRENRKVKIFDINGNLKMSTAENAFKAPNRVVVLKESRRILVKDEKFLKLLSSDGNIIGNFTNTQLKQPVGLAQSADGMVLVTEWTNMEVVVFFENGTRKFSFPCTSEAPGYISGSPNGNILVTDWKQHVVKIFNTEGKFLRQYGQHGTGEGQLDHPYGVCADKYNHILVTDTWNNRIQLLSEDGKFVSTLLNKENGIEWPQAVVADDHGHLIIVEQHGLVKIYQYMA